MNYLIKFDEKGYRVDTQVAEEKTTEQIENYLASDYELVEDKVYQLLIGNVDGKQYIKDPVSGEYVEEPPYIAPEPTEEEIQQQLTAAVQSYMDKTVQTRNYDNIHTACTYATSTDHVFAAEGLACVKWRDAVWRKCYAILAEVKAEKRAIPTVEELLAELPILEW